jgi:hypothetical protein
MGSGRPLVEYEGRSSQMSSQIKALALHSDMLGVLRGSQYNASSPIYPYLPNTFTLSQTLAS